MLFIIYYTYITFFSFNIYFLFDIIQNERRFTRGKNISNFFITSLNGTIFGTIATILSKNDNICSLIANFLNNQDGLCIANND